MRLLQYKDLDLRRVKPAFDKVRAAIEAGDFKSPDVKKLHAGGYYRAKLDYSNRLLLQFATPKRRRHETVCLALEVIENHAYDRSRFLRGALVDEAKIEREPLPMPPSSPPRPRRCAGCARAARSSNCSTSPSSSTTPRRGRTAHPGALVWSARPARARRRSRWPSCARPRAGCCTSRYRPTWRRAPAPCYAAHGYENPAQEADFLSYRELLETLRVPPGREVTLPAFAAGSSATAGACGCWATSMRRRCSKNSAASSARSLQARCRRPTTWRWARGRAC